MCRNITKESDEKRNWICLSNFCCSKANLSYQSTERNKNIGILYATISNCALKKRGKRREEKRENGGWLYVNYLRQQGRYVDAAIVVFLLSSWQKGR